MACGITRRVRCVGGGCGALIHGRRKGRARPAAALPSPLIPSCCFTSLSDIKAAATAGITMRIISFRRFALAVSAPSYVSLLA